MTQSYATVMCISCRKYRVESEIELTRVHPWRDRERLSVVVPIELVVKELHEISD
jgi:hypothetical protein